MTEEPWAVVEHLIDEMYHPFGEAEELVRCFGEAALIVTEAPRLEISLSCPAGAVAGLRLILGSELRSPSPRDSRFPIRYREDELGCLAVLTPARLSELGEKTCAWIAKSLSYHLKRLEVGRLARERYDREAPLIGTSDSLSRVDWFLEHASRTSLPALILASPGAEPERVALALHLLGSTREGAFVQVNCATLEASAFEQRLLRLLEKADGGTLLLARLQDLESRCQHLLCEVLEIGLGPWAAERRHQPVAVRLLVTATEDLDELARRGEICAALLDRLDFLRLRLEPLRNRRQDIRPLIEHYLRRHACGEVPEISGEVVAACVAYDWPGDVAELSRVVARLAVMTGKRRVLLEDLHTHAPQVLGEKEVTGASPPPLCPREMPLDAGRPERLQAIDAGHPALRKALAFIRANYQQKLSLADVAAEAFVSSSHLAHLFQEDLGTSFTRLLAAVRVDRAKHLLLEHPWKAIGAIAVEVGSPDLRHFERIFKSAVGCTPKQFRRISGAGRASRRATE